MFDDLPPAMSKRELTRLKQEKSRTVRLLAHSAREKQFFIPSQVDDEIEKQAKKQQRRRQQRLPRLFKDGVIVENIVENGNGGWDDIKTDLLWRDAKYGGVTDVEIFHRSKRRPHASINDVDILERIVLRENLLGEIAASVKRSEGDDDYGDLIPLFARLRHTTVDIIESIRCWRCSGATDRCPDVSRAFLFRGVNYISKISSDLDYLDSYEGLVRYMGFSFLGNPLIYAGGGIYGKDCNDISAYFEMQLSVGGIDVARLRCCEREIQSELAFLQEAQRAVSHANDANKSEEFNISKPYPVRFKVEK